LWSRRLRMWRVHDGVAIAGGVRGGFSPSLWKMFKNLNCIWSDSRYIPVSNLMTYLKISWKLKELIPANFVLFYLNERQNLLRVRWHLMGEFFFFVDGDIWRSRRWNHRPPLLIEKAVYIRFWTLPLADILNNKGSQTTYSLLNNFFSNR
jgi:hypothetical protein